MSKAEPKDDVTRRKTSLSRRFSIVLSSVVITILLIFSSGVVLYTSVKMQRQLDHQLADTLKLAETSLPTAVWQMDYSSMEDILGAILVNDAIASVRIFSDELLAAEKTQEKYAEHDFSFFRGSGKFTVKSVAVQRHGEKVGLFEVAISRAEIKRRVLGTVLIVLLLVVTLCFAIAVTSVMVTRRYIFKPLMRLESHARLVAGGNLESNIKIEGRDEFSQLAHAFNTMATQLKISFDTLEQKVMERTADLYLAKTEAEKMNQHLGIVGAELQALLDNSPVGILFVDFDRVIHRVNPEITRITGYSREELIGRTTCKLYPSEAMYRSLGETNYPLLRKYGFLKSNVEIRTKTGEIKMCSWRGKVIVGEEKIEGVVWSLEDISQQLQMEEELLKVKKLESIGVLAGGIAHDFNNLLLAIIGNISLAARLAPENSQLSELLLSAQSASERAKDLTSKLLTFSSGGEPVKATESLPRLLEESTSFALTGSNVKCHFDFPEDLWAIKMDKSQINQVVQNLVLNADQAMPEGGVVRISCKNVHISRDQVAGLETGDYVCVTVQDTGIGIRRENVGKIFDPYFSTKERDSNKGSGLGLSIVHSIISKHGGAILVDSLMGTGSTFTIYLPAMKEVPIEEQLEKKEVINGRGRILVMDDEEMIRRVVCQMLAQIGYDSVSVADGYEAMAVYENHFRRGEGFDAVIMDLTIPGGLGGKETVRRLHAIDPDARVIVSSGYSHDPILDDFEAFGFSNIVTKPYQLEELSRVLAATVTV